MIEYEKYYQKGGNYLIPTEIFNELLEENQELKAKIKTYKDPEDLTLMFMYCDEKAKDKIKELKKQLHEASIKMQEMIEQDIECPSNCSKLKELKKQLEENKDKINWYENFEINKTIDKLRIKHNNQQKEFMNYINAYIELLKDKPDLVEEGQKDILEEVLSKYKSIIGGKDE